MHSLKILCAYGNCGINDAGIKGLQLTELYAYGNPKITNIN
jgi:hypothetical protein